MDSAAAILRPLEVAILAGIGHRQQHLLQRLPRPLRAKRLAQDLPVLLLGGTAMSSGANLQLADNAGLYVSD